MSILTEPEKQTRFRVALSFPGEFRTRVQFIAEILAQQLGRDKILYDKWYEAEFARANLDVYLPKLYREESDLLVFFLSGQYNRKEWCGLEWRVGRDLLKQRQDEKLMFLRLDNVDFPGIYSIDGYIDIREKSDIEVAEAIMERLMIAAPENRQHLMEHATKAACIGRPSVRSLDVSHFLLAGVLFIGVAIWMAKSATHNQASVGQGTAEHSQRKVVAHLLRTTRGAYSPTISVNSADAVAFQFELPRIEAAQGALHASIVDIDGKSVWTGDTKTMRSTIDGDNLATLSVPSLAPGNYMLTVGHASGLDTTTPTPIAQYPFTVVRSASQQSSTTEVNHVEQKTSGPGSPAVQGVHGNVNITVDQSSSVGGSTKATEKTEKGPQRQNQ